MVSMDIGGSGGLLDVAAGVGIGIAGAAGAHIPAMIRCLDPQALGLVVFDFNPKEISFSRTNTNNTPSRTGRQTQTYTSKPAVSKIELKNIVFTGMTTKLFCDTLLTWMAPAHGLIGMLVTAAGGSLNIKPPNVTFQWGPPMLGFMYTALLSSCSVNYDRFDTTGIPIRAKVNITLTEVPSITGNIPTNPTSGGQPGRRTHILADGESLASLANRYYGRPGMWRRIAEVNGIDDPHRVKPGRTVYLPNPDEITSGAS
jgi:contractile injection system tube protein/LysM domain-containing protein